MKHVRRKTGSLCDRLTGLNILRNVLMLFIYSGGGSYGGHEHNNAKVKSRGYLKKNAVLLKKNKKRVRTDKRKLRFRSGSRKGRKGKRCVHPKTTTEEEPSASE